MMIPHQIKNFNFVILDKKNPIEPAWQKKIHKWDDPKLQEHISKGGNYGVQSNGSSIIINDKNYFLVIIDFDKKEFQDKVMPLLPETFTTTSGSPKNCYHLWFACDNNKAFKIHDENMDTLCDVIGSGNQVVAPGSKHSSGSTYSVVKDIPFAFISYAELEALLKPYDKKPKKQIKLSVPIVKSLDNSVASKSIDSLSMKQVLTEIGINISMNPTGCFAHASKGGKCLSWNEEVAHCFHCDGSWNKFSLIRDAKKFTDRETFEWFADKTGMTNELKKARKEYVSKIVEPFKIFSKQGQTEQFQKEQPIYYDNAGLWWLWNHQNLKWDLTDEVDILNMINKAHGVDIITSKSRTEILNSLKQSGRLNKPKQFPPTWIQFKDKIFDINTGESFNPTPEYFTVNPIPYAINFNTETPTFDKLFAEWVGENNKQLLYEILAYCLIQDYPIHRLFCFIGEGLNGKSCYLRIVRKFIGEQNTSATELDTLLNSRFEITRLYKKLICLMGETNFTEMAKTSVLKKLTGQDLIGFEYKNKVPFESINYAKILIATNNLPATTDKTIGFYRRWLIIDFPNRFDEGKDILASIPEEEYSNLASKCLTLLPTLLKERSFTGEGSIEERLKKYEERSNPFDKFWNENIEEDSNGYISKKDFLEKINNWCKENRFRTLSETSIAKYMKDKGVETMRKTMEWVEVQYNQERPRYWVWAGIKWKN